jgi:magnesium-transporting ATPase (P-type)
LSCCHQGCPGCPPGALHPDTGGGGRCPAGRAAARKGLSFTALVFAQLFNAFSSRSDTNSAFHRLFVNKRLWGSVLLAAALQFAVVEVPLLRQAFGTASLDAAHGGVCTGIASTVLWIDELGKLL